MKKYLLILSMVMVLGANGAMVSAHDEKVKDGNDQQMQSGDRNSNDGGGDQQSTVLPTESDFNFSVDSTNHIATLLYADGTPLANASVTVKNGESGQEGDIEMNQVADANGVFDYSQWVSQGAKVLRITDPNSSGTIEYYLDNGTMTIEAGKNKSADGSGHSHGGGSTTTYALIGGAVVLIGAGTGIVMMKKKKAKAEFEASKKVKGKKPKPATNKKTQEIPAPNV